MTILPQDLPPGLLLPILKWVTLALVMAVGGLMVVGATLQIRRDRQNRHRIACYQVWEQQLTEYLFKGGYARGAFGQIRHEDRWLFRNFLARYKPTLAGQESQVLRQLYLGLGVHASLPERLRSRNAKIRAQAAQEIATFQLDEPIEHDPPPVTGRPWLWKPNQRLDGILDLVLPLLNDPVPYVAHAAARALTRSRDLRYASPVLAWVMGEERYQRERLLRVLEGFGPDLLTWMQSNLEPPGRKPEPWVLYALLAGSHRHRESQPRLVQLLSVPQVDVRASALKALVALADPSVYPKVLPLASQAAWEIRAQAARALGLLGGPEAIPHLLKLTADRVYEVRRNAAQSLVDLGHAGISALTWLAEDPASDRFARDIAQERLEWADERGHL